VKQLFSGIESLVTITLVLAGIVGITYNAFRDGGWISQGFGKITDAYANYPLVALGLTVAMFFSYRAWRNATASGGGGKIFDLLVYVFMAAGTYFIARYVIKGEV
jgi:hypothetical protein